MSAVDVLAVMDDVRIVLTNNGPMTEARAAVAELMEAADSAAEQIDGSDFDGGVSIACFDRLSAALARCKGETK